VRILVYPHSMEVGGSQLNAIELAGAVRDRGHEVLVLSDAGSLVDVVDRLGLEWIPVDPRASRRPSATVVRQLRELTGRRGFDVLHGYEWPPGVEAFLAARGGTAAACTVMSMAVAPFLPRTMPLLVGTEDLRAGAASAGHRSVTLLEPPVDVVANAPSFPAGDFRAAHGLDSRMPLVVVVCRLVPELKLEGLLAACHAVGVPQATWYRRHRQSPPRPRPAPIPHRDRAQPRRLDTDVMCDGLCHRISVVVDIRGIQPLRLRRSPLSAFAAHHRDA